MVARRSEASASPAFAVAKVASASSAACAVSAKPNSRASATLGASSPAAQAASVAVRRECPCLGELSVIGAAKNRQAGVHAVDGAPAIFVVFTAAQKVEFAHACGGGLEDGRTNERGSRAIILELRIEAAEIGVGPPPIEEAVVDPDDLLTQQQGIEPNEVVLGKAIDGACMEACQTAIAKHSGFVTSFPPRPVQAGEFAHPPDGVALGRAENPGRAVAGETVASHAI